MAANDVSVLPNKIPYKIRLTRAQMADSIVLPSLTLLKELQSSPSFTGDNYYNMATKMSVDIEDPVFMAAYCTDQECIKEFERGKQMDLEHYSIRRHILQPGVAEYNLSLR